jgi:hypothetical protein
MFGSPARAFIRSVGPGALGVGSPVDPRSAVPGATPRHPRPLGSVPVGGQGGAILSALAVILTLSVAAGPVRALETPVGSTPGTTVAPVTTGTATAVKAGARETLTVKVGVVERVIEVDWARARAVVIGLTAGGARLAPGADAAVATLVKDLALSGEARERYLLFSRAADPKPSAADLQLSARTLRNALVSAVRAPQDAIVVASWTAPGDPPGAATVVAGASVGGFVLVPIVPASGPDQARALALDSAFAGVAELLATTTRPAPSAPSSVAAVPPPAPAMTPTPPAQPSVPVVAPPAAVAAPPPAAVRPSDPAARAVAVPAPAAPRPAAPERTGTVKSPPATVAAPSPVPPPAAVKPPTPKTTAAVAVPLPKVRPLDLLTGARPAKPPRAERGPVTAAVERPTPPVKPAPPTTRTPTAKVEPARRPERVAGCAPPRIILDDFYPGGPIIACDGTRR